MPQRNAAPGVAAWPGAEFGPARYVRWTSLSLPHLILVAWPGPGRDRMRQREGNVSGVRLLMWVRIPPPGSLALHAYAAPATFVVTFHFGRRRGMHPDTAERLARLVHRERGPIHCAVVSK